MTATLQRLTARVVLASVVSSAIACSSERDADPRPNLVLVVVDTLRFDHVGCYGASNDTTPAMDAFARKAVRFEHAYSTAPWTSPSVASILTGKYPSGHGLMLPLTGLSEEVDTLAEILSAEGYATAGVVSNSHLKKRNGFHQGFDTYLDSEARWHKHVSTPGITRQATELVDQLSAGDKPFFLFVLYFDPHYEYKRHPEFGFAGDSGRLTGKESIERLRKVSDRLSDTEKQFVRDVYDEEVRFTDGGIDELLGKLKSTGQFDNTLVAITSDHGEEFWERGWIGHTRTLYEELVRVPLLMRPPGDSTAYSEATPVSLVSLAPTLLGYAGIDSARHGITTPSLAPFLEGESPIQWPSVFCEVDYAAVAKKLEVKAAHKRVLLRDRLKLIRDNQTGALELYDLSVDPLEQNDLAASRPDQVRELAALLEQADLDAQAGAAEGTQLELTEEELEGLRGLGYAGSDPEKRGGDDDDNDKK